MADHKIKILIIDDEKNIRLTLRDILEDEGHHVLEAGTGEDGLALLKNENVDLVLLDVRLPGMDGIEVLKGIREIDETLDVIMISGHATVGTAVDALRIGAYDFLEKPLSLARVKLAIRNLSEKQTLAKRSAVIQQTQKDKYRLVGTSPQIEQVLETARRVGPTSAKVLIRGESGTGKELVAHAIHAASPRAEDAFVKFNAAAIPSELVESELFGHEKGAFTGAVGQKKGKIEMANSGTLFLDEIGDMSLSAQAKILRVLEDGKFERVGGTQTQSVDIRLLAATNKHLEEMVSEGGFREDLFYRLNVVPINLPPLREREGDIKTLLNHFLAHYAAELNLFPKQFSRDAMNMLVGYPFPGNIRELRNLIERLYILSPNDEIDLPEVKPHLNQVVSAEGDAAIFAETRPFAEAKRMFEERFLESQLRQHAGNISRTANSLGMQQSNLSRKLKELGLGKS
ncbi:MAG: sigma-54-dependent Fis family transcriptional regulator [Candidatus Marinimicrobia bacterium]|nr:sigma-54-dependent Fis family transcriptional regulator [Candidatus Neomarinimicrobiota bacterium]MBT4946378.1 sigma-54-dependent Fis family transcriptional regulator [Candidatus Neomarinimicrobiota bacterium]MBT5268839.1 sigma-54-dependent Fis family transcriptional regulator [Candidatus Neomarinimicrobiota bacterium]MBT6010426.1 sigma-54-dependent Fis family transcriptional regulator [Candidatus Neomarinimicrobiota bacterium]MBT7828767.1 sigma-54-dependent Fis family transcriptional regula